MRYRVKKQCSRKINSFYHNVSKKYKHTYSEELMHKNIDDAINSIYQIERTLLRREPTIAKWAGYYMANTDITTVSRKILHVIFKIAKNLQICK